MKKIQRVLGVLILLMVITISCSKKEEREENSITDKNVNAENKKIDKQNRIEKNIVNLIEGIQNDTLKTFLQDQHVLTDLKELSRKAYKELDTTFFSFYRPQISMKGFRKGVSCEFSEEEHNYKVKYEGQGYLSRGIFCLSGNIFIVIEDFDDPMVCTYAFLLDQEQEKFTLGIPAFVDILSYQATASLNKDKIIVKHFVNKHFVGDTSSFVNGKFVEKFLVEKDTLLLVQ
ncbi:hypothetical protein GCM10011506_25440 [Marivirga lumbricoides]|uniref:Lipoprotein n=1 Tax=Marivirga lumbricoides TaxID=1046115 RepID=A0ABQ1MKK5_9BACT|nr:hypothetical protein GCM10011506_25440 [Marivirga lumbricoides]